MQTIRFKKGLKAVEEIASVINSLEDDKEYVCEIKKYRKKRSKNANSYMWELIGQLSQETNEAADVIYRRYIKEYGIFRDIEIQPDAQNTLEHVWSAYGLGWFCDVVDNVDDKVTLRLYYGSSSYNSKQMSVVINAVVEDCKALGIETLTPEELAVLECG